MAHGDVECWYRQWNEEGSMMQEGKGKGKTDLKRNVNRPYTK
jgi:hypothetical protein